MRDNLPTDRPDVENPDTGPDGGAAHASARSVRISEVVVSGKRLRVAVWPGDPVHVPLLLFNGIGARLELLAPFVDALGSAAETITFDIPGAGESPPPLLPYRLWMLARLTSHLLDVLGYERVDVLGISWGGTIAQQFAFQCSSRCRKLILAATTQGILMVPGSLQALLKLAGPRRHNDPAYLKENFGKMYGGAARVNPELFEQVAPLVGPANKRGYLFQQLALAGWTSLPWLPFLRQPTLVLAGDDDPLVPVINARLMASLIPEARLHVLHDGHFFLISSAAECAAVVREFLNSEGAS
jgi:poly(3-hydroxyoctanoate) depolymerase